jgi:hypothetical protein
VTDVHQVALALEGDGEQVGVAAMVVDDGHPARAPVGVRPSTLGAPPGPVDERKRRTGDGPAYG